MKFRALLIGCLLVWALPMLAATMPPCPVSLPVGWSDSMVVCNGPITVEQYPITELDEYQNPDAIYTLTSAPDLSQFGHATVFCEYAGTCGPGLPQMYYSDIFGVAFTNGGYYLAYSSDWADGTPYAGSSAFIYVAGTCGEHAGEWCGWYDATMYLDPALQAQGYTAWFISTPEPTTMLLLGSGIGLLARKLRKK